MARAGCRGLVGGLLLLLLALPHVGLAKRLSKRRKAARLEAGWKVTVTLSASNSPLTQQVAGALAPAGSVVTSVKLDPASASSVIGVAFAANASGAIMFTLLDPNRLPTRGGVRATFGAAVPGAAAVKYGLITLVGAANRPPAGPAVVPLGSATLGVPRLLAEGELLAGWSDPDGNDIGVIGARVRDRRRGVAAAAALAPASWSPVRTIQNRRITELTYTCALSALTVRKRFAGPSARKPKCVSRGAEVLLRVSDARYATKPAKATLTVQQGPMYPHFIKGLDGGKARGLAKLLGFGAPLTRPAISAGSLAWSGGLTAGVSPPAGATTAVNMSFAGVPSGFNSSDASVAVTVSLPAGATMFGLRAALVFPTKGSLKLIATVAGPGGAGSTRLVYPLSPAGQTAGPKAYAAVAVFGEGYTLASVQVVASNMVTGGKLTLGSDFDIATGKVAFPKLF